MPPRRHRLTKASILPEYPVVDIDDVPYRILDREHLSVLETARLYRVLSVWEAGGLDEQAGMVPDIIEALFVDPPPEWLAERLRVEDIQDLVNFFSGGMEETVELPECPAHSQILTTRICCPGCSVSTGAPRTDGCECQCLSCEPILTPSQD